MKTISKHIDARLEFIMLQYLLIMLFGIFLFSAYYAFLCCVDMHLADNLYLYLYFCRKMMIGMKYELQGHLRKYKSFVTKCLNVKIDVSASAKF